MEKLDNRYGILVNDDEWDLLYRSVTFRRDNVEEITGTEPEDLTQLAEDLLTIKTKGYLKTDENIVTEDDVLGNICGNCE